MISRRAYIILSLVVLVSSAAWITFTRPTPGSTNAGDVPLARPGFIAPDFELVSLDGKATRLSDLRGKVVILNLWASWCPPCRAEMPALERVYQDYTKDDLVVIGLNLTSQDTAQAAADFAHEIGLSFPVLLDENGEAGQRYRTEALPTTFFIDREGVIREMIVGGPISEALLRAQAERLLSEAP